MGEDMLYEIESVRRFSGFQTSDPPSLPTCPVLSASGPHWPAGLPVERRSACLVRQTPGFAGSGTVLPPPGARLALPIAATTGPPPGPGQWWGQRLEPGQVQRQAWRFTSYWPDDGPQVNDVTGHKYNDVTDHTITRLVCPTISHERIIRTVLNTGILGVCPTLWPVSLRSRLNGSDRRLS